VVILRSFIVIQVVVVWRKDSLKIQFDSLENGWYASGEELERSRHKLAQLINWWLESADRLTFDIELPQELLDEHAKVSNRMILKLLDDFLKRFYSLLHIRRTDFVMRH
jgi:hypothetical protein